MLSYLRIFVLSIFFSFACHAETPNAPQAQDNQQSIESNPGQNIVEASNGTFHLTRWSVSGFAIHDKNGWGPSSRVDYRITNRFGIAATEVKSTVSVGFTVRFGTLK